MSKFNLVQSQVAGGLSAIILPRSERETVTFMVLIGVGSRYETPKQSGLSHFLEHMFFKGTETRPSAKEVAEALDSLGAEFNAFTGEEYTGYYVKVAKENFETGAEVISDFLLKPLFAQEEIDKERGVIVEEIRMYTDQPMRHIWHLFNEAMFGNHPLGKRIDGREETVNAFNRKDFVNYTKKHYHTGNAIVAVAGAVDVNRTKKTLEKLLKDLPKGEETYPKRAPVKLGKEKIKLETRQSLDQTHVVLGVPGLALGDEALPVVEVMATILGGGMSSRLFMSVREQRGLAYMVKTYQESFVDSGFLATQAGVKTEKAVQAVEVIGQEYDRLMEELVSPDELAKAKRMLRGRMKLSLEETNALTMFAGQQALLEKKIKTPDEILSKIERVTAENIQELANRLLARNQRVLAVLGPQRSSKAFEKVM